MNAIDREYFFSKARHLHTGGRLSQTQVQGYNAILDYWLLNYGEKGTLSQLAYILATAFHETGQRMEAVRESFAVSDAQAIKRLSNRKYARRDSKTGEAYYGRGFIQTTWKDNYKKVGEFLSEKMGREIDLVLKPDLLLKPEYSIPSLVDGMYLGMYTEKKLAQYVNATFTDFVNARRIVNGTDKATLIAGYATKFGNALRYSAVTGPSPATPTGLGVSDSNVVTGPNGASNVKRERPTLTEIPIPIDSLPITPPAGSEPVDIQPLPPHVPPTGSISILDRVSLFIKKLPAKTMNAVLLQIARVLVMLTGGTVALTSEDSIWVILGTILYAVLGLLMPKQNKKEMEKTVEEKVDSNVVTK